MEKVKSIYVLLLAVFIISCRSETESKKTTIESKTDTINKVNQHIYKNISDTTIDIRNRVFEFGSTTHLDECRFYFECDCCSGEFIFKPDYTFYYIDYCMSDLSVTRGTYHINNNYVYLSADSIRVQELYNWEQESDTSAIEYILSDSIIKPYKMQFAIHKCESNIKLIDMEDPAFVALSSDKNQDSILTILKKKGIIKRFVY
ncbi:hypothetical protein MYP_3373 [Sporocytophaga myxococcoides]|uniref:Lipoprotein n=1 Tax=Sporocytophaga myxococcoides TaxID=153721 RepID=A0A098LI48_9BACT|nr:hypothetical protein [Sporocytophaga myxococcoides]GAL86144.1 hypothetical protein MYP_3373 [Sporocytophaga myxococcoides]